MLKWLGGDRALMIMCLLGVLLICFGLYNARQTQVAWDELDSLITNLPRQELSNIISPPPFLGGGMMDLTKFPDGDTTTIADYIMFAR